MWQDVPREQVAFGGVGVAGQDEGFDAQLAVGVELAQDLVGVAHDCGAASGTRASDTGPQVVFDVPVTARTLTQFRLPADAGRLTGAWSGFCLFSSRGPEARLPSGACGAARRFGLAYDHVHAIAKSELASAP